MTAWRAVTATRFWSPGAFIKRASSTSCSIRRDLKGKCAIVTSYKPSHADIKGEESGEGVTEKLREYDIYQKMLADWFNEAPAQAVKRSEEFEKEVKKKFIDEPGQMKLLIVVDKLLDRLRRSACDISLHR